MTNLRSEFVLWRFSLKKRFLSLHISKIKSNYTSFWVSDLWDETFFPNYGGQSLSTSGRSPLPSPRNIVKGPAHSESFASRSSYAHFLQNLFSLAWSTVQWSLNLFKRTIGDGIIYLRGLAILFFFDAMLTDDEPLWEPVEWSLIQSWIMFIFAFAWIGENLISSRFGSYTGRDKRVWFSWYKTFWLIEGWYVLSLGAAALFVMVPFYHEISYTLPLVVSWWNWYSRVFFFKFISSYSLILYLAYYLQLNLGSFHWRKSLALILLINLFLSYLLYTHFLMSFFVLSRENIFW